MGQPQFLESFENTLHEIYQNLQQFIATLDAEKVLLQENKHAELDEALATKRLLIQSLEQISSQCQTMLSNGHFPFNEASVLNIISKFPHNKQDYLQNLWQEIKASLKECDRKNMVNGVMITTLKNHNDSLLQIITQRPKDAVYSNQSKKYNIPVSTRDIKA